jgi:TRAP-type mannitol/chloroaromatic compound transport system permease small subunit
LFRLSSTQAKEVEVQGLIKFSKIVDAITERSGQLATFVVVITIAIGFFNVAARYVGRFIGLQLSSNLFIELQWYLYSLVFFLGFAFILKHGVNVRVDFLYAKWPEKRKALVDFLGHLLFVVPFCVMGIYVTINPVLSSWGRLPNGSWGTWELSADPNGLPRAPIKTMIIIAFVLLLFQTISELIKLYAILRGQEVLVKDMIDHGDSERPIE